MEKLKSLSSTAGKKYSSAAPASTKKYCYVERYRGQPDENDITLGRVYSTYEEAENNYKHQGDDCGAAVITKLNGRWYRVTKDSQGQMKYRDLHALQLKSWRTEKEIERGIDLNSIPVKDLMAMAAATAYCNGTFARELAVKEEDLHASDFYKKFNEFFGKPMHKFGV